MTTFYRSVARILIVSTLGWGMPTSSMAGIVTTEEVNASAQREQVLNFLARSDVQARMQSMGVDPAAARDRVAALSDEEVATLSGEIERLPAGGTEVLGALLLVFVILLITDILGFTKVFPFTRPVQR